MAGDIALEAGGHRSADYALIVSYLATRLARIVHQHIIVVAGCALGWLVLACFTQHIALHTGVSHRRVDEVELELGAVFDAAIVRQEIEVPGACRAVLQVASRTGAAHAQARTAEPRVFV